jgi:hypothetical protein
MLTSKKSAFAASSAQEKTDMKLRYMICGGRRQTLPIAALYRIFGAEEQQR